MSQPDPLPPPLPAGHNQWRRRSSGFWVGGLLVLLGLYFLLRNLGLLEWLSSDIVWPLVLIGVGLYLVVRRLR